MLKALHVLAAILFVGNVIVTGVWAMVAFGARARAADFAPAARAIWVTDALFSVGGAALLVVTGVVQARRRGLDLWEVAWIRDALLLLVASTAIWLAAVVPQQRAMSRATAADDDAALVRAFRRWNAWGWLATAPLVVAVWRMVAR